MAPWASLYWKEKDPKRFVLDEVSGYLVIPLVIRLFENNSFPLFAVSLGGFLLFRLFDILKPPGARWMDLKEGAIFIMLDDIISGIYASLVLGIILKLSR